MSFKFDFDIEDQDDSIVVPAFEPRAAPASSAGENNRAPAQPCKNISLQDLLATLPEFFSYSPLSHPLGGSPLLRRDLYDARFQLALGDAEASTPAPSSQAEAGQYVDADTDLIPGTYEGGLKSWEGGVDLVEVIARGVGHGATAEEEGRVAEWVRGARVLEVGCGTALPSAYLLRSLLSTPAPTAASASTRTVLHLQDYNLPVLTLVTLPNLILAALPSLPASARAAAETARERVVKRAGEANGDKGLDTVTEADEDAEAEADMEAGEEDEEEEEDDTPLPFDPTRAGTLEITPALVAAFTDALEEHNIELRFTYGDWSGMAVELELAPAAQKYNLVLSAETIYEEASVGPLIDVLRASTAFSDKRSDKVENLEDSLGSLNIRDDWDKAPLINSDPVILIAAKVLYFGVGGGLDSFLARVAQVPRGWHVRVRDWVRGVGRAVIRVGW